MKIEHRGLKFKVYAEKDHYGGCPWDDDGVGIVRRGPPGSKTPGEIILQGNAWHALSVWLYDWAGTMKKAKEEQWGLSPEAEKELAEFTQRMYGRGPTAGERRRKAVQQDFDRMRGYLYDKWQYVEVYVYVVDDHGDTVESSYYPFPHSVGGIEEDCSKETQCYIREVAMDIIEENFDQFAACRLRAILDRETIDG